MQLEIIKKKKVVLRYIQLAVRNDEKLNKLFKDITFTSRGALPHVHKELLRKKR